MEGTTIEPLLNRKPEAPRKEPPHERGRPPIVPPERPKKPPVKEPPEPPNPGDPLPDEEIPVGDPPPPPKRKRVIGEDSANEALSDNRKSSPERRAEFGTTGGLNEAGLRATPRAARYLDISGMAYRLRAFGHIRTHSLDGY